ncbi:MAG: GtrA family protein [Burkholderiales bacterium]|nr:GtrA family protein [Burkholderiales bacterium]MDE2076676.1 GtrA family protein [Burkholderiales bacterium]MDE2431562.1 GtrA family protein [Burkholderiales bacterium]
MAPSLRSLLLFCVSGGLALLIDIGVLYALKGWLGYYWARAISFACAATFTWLFNRSLTFKGPREGGLVREYLAYLSSMAVGGAINYGVYVLSLALWPWVQHQPAIGVALGSLAGLGFNFWSARRILKTRPSQST